MTGWIPDVIPDALIESAWGNKIRDRTVSPFATAAERATSVAAPKVGMLSWLADLKRLELYDGTNWGPLPGTLLDSWTSTADATSAGTAVALPGFSRAVTVGAGPRRLRVDVQGGMSNATAANVGQIRITIDGAECARIQRTISTSGATTTVAEYGAAVNIIDNVAAGARTFAGTVNRPQGGGSVVAHAGVRIMVTDLGPA